MAPEHSEPDAGLGVLVSVDGPGGAGKSTATRLVTAALIDYGVAALDTREPTTGPVGVFIRDHLATIGGNQLACLVAADRHDHLEKVIEPAISRGQTVICDRYIASSLALQVVDGVDRNYVEALNLPMRRPDLAVFLHVSPEVAWARVSKRGPHGRFETAAEQLTEQCAQFKRIAADLADQGWRTAQLDTDVLTPDQIAHEVAAVVARDLRRSIG